MFIMTHRPSTDSFLNSFASNLSETHHYSGQPILPILPWKTNMDAGTTDMDASKTG
jgi:hypothetical protein